MCEKEEVKIAFMLGRKVDELVYFGLIPKTCYKIIYFKSLFHVMCTKGYCTIIKSQ